MAFEYSSVYAVSKVRSRRVDGALAPEVAPFGIHTTIVNPGFFRTRLRAPHRSCGQISIHDTPNARRSSDGGGVPETATRRVIPTNSPELC